MFNIFKENIQNLGHNHGILIMEHKVYSIVRKPICDIVFCVMFFLTIYFCMLSFLFNVLYCTF